MYSILIFFHSALRWLVLIFLIYSIYTAYRGWFRQQRFSRHHNNIRTITVTVMHLQFTVGMLLYMTSPIISYFIQHFSEAVHNRDIRFFGMEHATLMLVAVVLVTTGSALTKRAKIDREKFRRMALWFTIGLVIILLAIPWSFSPFTSRPLIREW